MRKGLAVLAAWCAAMAAGQIKRPLTHGDYDGWKSISAPALSRDGKVLAYGLFPQEGDGHVVVRRLDTGQEWREAAGAPPPPPAVAAEEPQPAAAQRTVRLAFTRDGRYLVSTTFPSRADTDAARKARRKPEEMPRGGLLLMDTATGAAARAAGVKSMQVPERGGALAVYLKEPAPAKEQKTEGPKKEYGSELVVRDLGTGAERGFADAVEYAVSKDGATLLYTVSSRKEEENGVYAAETGGSAAPAALVKGKGKYSKLAWERENRRAAFLGGEGAPSLYVWERGGGGGGRGGPGVPRRVRAER